MQTAENPSKTWMAKNESVDRNWWIVDATDQRVGRLATTVATLLRGKQKPTFTPQTDVGDFVIVINTDKLQMTGAKFEHKKYYRHSRFFGSMKEKTAAQMMIEDSCHVMEAAVKGMLPDNKMSYALMTKLKTFKGPEHNHAAQKPQAFAIKKNDKKK